MSTIKRWPTLSSCDMRSSIMLNSKREVTLGAFLCIRRVGNLSLRFHTSYFYPFLEFLLIFFFFALQCCRLSYTYLCYFLVKVFGDQRQGVCLHSWNHRKVFFQNKNISSICRQRNQTFTFVPVDTTAKRAGRITLSRVELKKSLKAVTSLLKYLGQNHSILKIIQFVKLSEIT